MGKFAGEDLARRRASYGLSPMQSGMLFEALLHGQCGQAAGYNIEQMHMVLPEAIDCDAFGRAWTSVARRHPALATAFRWEGIAHPVQEVHGAVVVPIEQDTLQGADDTARAEALRGFLARDRVRGFDLRVPPLMRVSVLRSDAAHTHVVWTFHHILLDGRSFPIVLRDVFATYRALCRGESAQLPEPPTPYADFVAWLAERDPQQSRPYFQKLLSGKSTPTPLPIAEPIARPLQRSGYGDSVFVVSEAALRAAEALAANTATTMATVAQAAWALVLSAFTGDEDVVFGATRSCRRSAFDGKPESGDANAMVGLFMNTLPVRARTFGELRVADLLRELRGQSVAMREHEHTPLSDVQSWSEVPRGSALFETFVMFENQALGDMLRATGDVVWQAAEVVLHEQPSPALSAIIVHSQDGLELHLLFDCKRFTDAAIARIGASFCATIEQLGRSAEQRLADVDVLPPGERRRIVHEWNDTARAFPDQLCIFEPFEQRADLQPAAAALEFLGETLSYAEVEARANKLAHALRQRGARPGVYVGLCLSRGFDLVVTLLGIAKSGAAYLPLDPDHPRERLAFMVEDAAALMVVTEQAYESLFATPTLVLDGDDRESIAAQQPTRLPRVSAPTDLCYVIFTSGSTGQPKGVVLSHRAVINTFDWVTRTFEIGAGDRLLFVTSPCFDLSVYDTFGALGAGATVVIGDCDMLRDPALLAEAIVDRRITVWDSAPAALQRLSPFFPPARADSPLRRVMLSGDWIPLTLPDAIRASFPNAQVKSLGGATEAAIWSNWYPVGDLDPRWASVPYGRPIQNARYHVLDARLRPVPVGVAGDLYIGGTCLAEGYLNRAELTAERFIADPFHPGTSERLYKTGDLARYFDNGDLEFLGRSDFQVKDPRLPRRDGRSRDRAARGRRGARRDLCGVRRRVRAEVAGRVRGRPGASRASAAGCASRASAAWCASGASTAGVARWRRHQSASFQAAARLHGAVGGHGARLAAAVVERQSRSQSAAVTDGGGGRRSLSGAAHRSRAGARRDLGTRAQARADRRARQLLRSRRPLDVGRDDHVGDAESARPRGPAVAHHRVSDRRAVGRFATAVVWGCAFCSDPTTAARRSEALLLRA